MPTTAMNGIDIIDGRLDHPQVIALLREHLAGMHEHTPPQSIHALPLALDPA
jgi:putative acetyltransferase